MPDLKNCRSLQFLTDTSLERKGLDRGHRPEIARTEPFKTYPGAEPIPLPTDGERGMRYLRLDAAISARTCRRPPSPWTLRPAQWQPF